MKMKSRLFGINAIVALAILAFSSATLTSCYKSEKEDVVLPFKPSDPVYTITGEITDITTGEKLDGVKIDFTVDSKTVQSVSGSYSYTTKKHGSYKVDISHNGYKSISRTLEIQQLEKGQASTYILNAALYPTDFNINKMEMDVKTTQFGTTRKEFDSNDLGIINNDSKSPLFVSLTFGIDNGTRYLDNALADALAAGDIDNEFKTGIEDFLKSLYGKAPIKSTDNFGSKDVFYEFNVAPLSSVKSVTAITYYQKDTFILRYGDMSVLFDVIVPYKVEFSHALQANTHGGTHVGHGHGNGLNAGGGIIDPIN